eukprot:235027-Chlamydomonas_euryale.AAC.1
MTVLARHWDSLAEPAARGRAAAAARAAHLRPVVGELKKVCSHPYLLPEFEPALGGPTAGGGGGGSGGSGGGPSHREALQALGATSAAAAASAKLQLLPRLLALLAASGRRALLLSHASKLLDMVEGAAVARLGRRAVQRIDSSTPSAERHAAVVAFRDEACPVSLFLMTARSCGLGTDLPRVDAVLLFDSDWHPALDLQVWGVGRVRGTGREEWSMSQRTPEARVPQGVFRTFT